VRASVLPDIFQASIAIKTLREILTAVRGAIEFSTEHETFRPVRLVKSAHPRYQIVSPQRREGRRDIFFLFFAVDPPKIPADRKDGKE
jgi:hypothetical protein